MDYDEKGVIINELDNFKYVDIIYDIVMCVILKY